MYTAGINVMTDWESMQPPQLPLFDKNDLIVEESKHVPGQAEFQRNQEFFVVEGDREFNLSVVSGEKTFNTLLVNESDMAEECKEPKSRNRYGNNI